MKLFKLMSLSFLMSCSQATVKSVEYISVPNDWKHERSECAPLDEILLMSDGKKVVILQCPDGSYVGADLITGKVIK